MKINRNLFLITALMFFMGCGSDDEPQPTEPTDPVLKLNHNNLNFGDSDKQLSLTIHNDGVGTLYWNFNEDVKWILPDLKAGNITTESETITLTVVRAGLDKGSHSANIKLESNGGEQMIAVKLEVKEKVEMQGSFNDSRDNRNYKWVQIGNQTWMAENLAFKNEKKCYVYNNDEDNAAKYGRLYEMSILEEVCPEGWHIPTLEEWQELVFYMQDQQNITDKTPNDNFEDGSMYLKSTTEWLENGNGTDAFGFNALPAGRLDINNEFDDYGESTSWWTKTIYPDNKAFNYSVFLKYNTDWIGFSQNSEEAISIRCIKN